jgi:predicted DCC family thiol-disulfide oxidoreductase YuxK
MTSELTAPSGVRVSGWVLYDDACGFCRKWVPFWGPTLRKRGFEIAPLQSDWVREKLGVTDEDLVLDLRLLLENGSQIRGADVYRHVMRRIGWAYPFYLLSITPVLRDVFDWAYRTFARNRHRFSRACRLPGGSEWSAKRSADRMDE